MQVLKFGGSSVANAAIIKQVIGIIARSSKKDNTIITLSAMGGITDLLIQCGTLAAKQDELYKELAQQVEQRHLTAVKELLPVTQQSGLLSAVKKYCNEIDDICAGIFSLHELSARTLDRLVSFGEILSSRIIAAALNAENIAAVWKDSRELISTNSNFGNAAVDFEKTFSQINSFIAGNENQLLIMPGFISSDENHITTTLGRGGSDYTAAIFAAATNATVLEIWTDVSGMMTADPRLVPNAKHIPKISYQEAMELSHFGAKVIYPPTIQPVMKKIIPVLIKNTFAPNDAGTIIQHGIDRDENTIRGISSINSIALLSLEGSGMVGIPGFSKRLFESLSNAKINVILITQSSSEHSICVGIDASNADKAKKLVDQVFEYEIKTGTLDPLQVEKGLAIVALVGDGMRQHTGVSGKMFHVLGRNGVNIRAIAQGSSERNISAVVDSTDVKKAINVLHESFFETTYRQLNLFIIGAGNVGSKLLSQLQQQQDWLQEKLQLQLRVVGLANSRNMLYHEEGLALSSWKEQLAKATPMLLDDFVAMALGKNLRNSVFVDVTANEVVASCYERLLEKSISVVACNKVACSSSYDHYKKLKSLSREFNAMFRFETNVGAGLPVIGTLNSLLQSGDTINRIEAVLSGTLNFVFNNYDGSRPFAAVVKQAQDEGYTEPDPRLDLGGMDVMRKIMILAREAGFAMELDEVTNQAFMPSSCMQGSIEHFYDEMEKQESHFKALYDGATANGNKLKFVARLENGRASVGLTEIDPEHDFFHLYGKDNVVRFYTNRYKDQPLVIKGAGAGAEVTASGVFADIISTVS